MILAGSHGDEGGLSALSSQDKTNVRDGNGFYMKACEIAGVEPVKRANLAKMPYKLSEIPDIMKLEKASPLPDSCMNNDEDLCNMTTLVAHIGYYHKQEDKLLEVTNSILTLFLF